MNDIWKYVKWGGGALVVLCATIALAATFERIPADILKLGNGSATDKTMEMDIGNANNPFMKYDQTAGKFVFSNDGVNEKDIGSGSGSGAGLNDLQNSNPDCEAATGGVPNSWTASGGTLSQTNVAGELINGLQSCSWDSNAAAQTLDSELVAINPRLIGTACLERVYYRYDSGSAGDLTVQVFDGTNPITDPQDVLVTTNPVRGLIELAFTCPASGSYQVRFTSVAADPGELIWDDVKLGDDDRRGATESAVIGPSTSYSPVSNLTTNIQDEGGTYWQVGVNMFAKGTLEFSGVNTEGLVQLSIPGGVTLDSSALKNSATGTEDQIIIGSWFIRDASASGNWTDHQVYYDFSSDAIFLRSSPTATFNTSAGTPITIADGDVFSFEFSIPIVEWAQDGSQETVTLETQGWFIDATVSGANSDSIHGGQTYAPYRSSSWTMAFNGKSASAEIGCSSTNPPTGTTCAAGQEETSIAFTPPRTGSYKVCFTGHINMDGDASGDIQQTYYQLWETEINSQTQIGMGTKTIGSLAQGANPTHVTIPEFCDVIEVTNISKKMVRFVTDVNVTGTPTSNTLYGDLTEDRKFGWRITPLTEETQAIALTGVDDVVFVQTNSTVSGLSDDSFTDMIDTGTTFEPGKYIFEYGGACRVQSASAPTGAFGSLIVTDDSNTGLDPAASVNVGCVVPITTGADERVMYSDFKAIELTSPTIIKLRGKIGVTGGSGITREWGQTRLKITKVGDNTPGAFVTFP